MISIKSVMTTDVCTIKPDAAIFDALEMLVKKKISGLPVVNEENEVVGILSEKDVLRILMDDKANSSKTVSDYMSRDVSTFSEDGDAVQICKFFMRTNFRRVPIVKDKKLVGIVSRRDIVEVIHEAQSTLYDSLRY